MVTGALGFIGFHLCESLLNEGIEVIAVDYCTPSSRLVEEKLFCFGRNALFHYRNESTQDVIKQDIVKQCDVIYHLAAITSSKIGWSQFEQLIKENVEATKQLVEHSSSSTRMIYASSVDVYGERFGELTENTPTSPSSAYAMTKLAAERYLEKRDDREIITLRLPTIYGPWQREDMAFQQVLLQKENNEPLQMKEDRNTVDLLYVTDVAQAFYKAGTTKKAKGIFNLSSGEIGEWYRAKSILLDEPHKVASSPQQVFISNKKAANKLQFKKRTSIEQGLKRQEEHVKQWKALYNKV